MSANLHSRGITITDPDGRGGNCDVVLSCSVGTINVTEGNSGVDIISGDTTATVALRGTIIELNNLFTGNSTGTIVFTHNATGAVTFKLVATDEDSLASTITFAGTIANYVPPVVGVPGGTVNANISESNNLHGIGFTLSDADDVDEYATLVLAVNNGTISVTPGNSGTSVTTGNGTATVTVVGTITALAKLLAASGGSTGLIRWTPASSGTKNIVLTVTDGDGQVGTNNKDMSVGVRPVVTTPATYLAATTNIDFNVHGAGFSVADSDTIGDQTLVLSVTNGTVTVVEGDSGITIDSGNGTDEVSLTGTLAEINHLLQDTGTGTIKYLRTADATETFTVTVTDDTGRIGDGDVTITSATGITWSGYAVATPVAALATLNNYVGAIDLSHMPSEWWDAVAEDGRDIRVTNSNTGVTTSQPRDLYRFDKATQKGLLFTAFQHSTTPPSVRVWVGASLATGPLPGDANGQHNVYDAATYQAWWPDGGGDDRTANANDLTMTNATAGDTTAVGSFKATDYGLNSYGKCEVAVPNAVPESFFCFVDPTATNATYDFVGSVHGTLRNVLGQKDFKIRANSRISNSHEAFATGSVSTGWMLAVGTFYNTILRTAYRDGSNAGANSDSAAGVAGADAYVTGGLGEDNSGTISVSSNFYGDLSLTFVILLATAGLVNWVDAYKNVFNQSAYWGTWIWTVDSEAGL